VAAARRKHLAKEKEFTRLRDQLSRERRELPWELVGKEYVFEDGGGRHTLADTFEERSQLVIYHAMFNPETAGPRTTWTTDAPCFVCSFWMDNLRRSSPSFFPDLGDAFESRVHCFNNERRSPCFGTRWLF
jgi:predicted dithiol-disulfide oxidoreductase (DUF899 family)